MKRRKQGSRDMLERHRAEYQRNLEAIAQLTTRNEELKPIITEEENMEIVALVRSSHIGLEELQRFMEGLRNGEVPFLMVQNDDKQGNEEEKADEME